MPPILTEFSGLRRLELFNSTLASWATDASVTEHFHPVLRAIRFVKTNMSSLPPGLVHARTPRSLNVFRMMGGNLTSLPAELGDLWSSKQFATIQVTYTQLQTLPLSFGRILVNERDLIRNLLEEFPDDLWATAKLTRLWLSDNPLRRLPRTIGDVSALVEVAIEDTFVEEVPAWMLEWLTATATKPSVVVALRGSPLCNAMAADKWARACARSRQTDILLEMPFLYAQRPFD
ncbi:hypothetical protein PINS_up017424 [Pythium insidiosum]|nr:hypothetical protein PINS_up017424 [Pythium insidiosum]